MTNLYGNIGLCLIALALFGRGRVRLGAMFLLWWAFY